jgi:hypothetical protein
VPADQRPPQPGDRVRHDGEQYARARRHGTGTVVRREQRGRFPGAIVRMDRHPFRDEPYEDWWADEDLFVTRRAEVEASRVDT